MKKTTIAAIATAATLALPAAAGAHVTLQPGEAASGSFSKMDVRVPNERDNKGTIKVDVRFPDGFYFFSYQKVPGWKARVFKEKLDQPVDLGGFEVDEQFTRIVWTARRPQARPDRPGPVPGLPALRSRARRRGRLAAGLPRVPDLPARRARGLDRRARQRHAGPACHADGSRAGVSSCPRVTT